MAATLPGRCLFRRKVALEEIRQGDVVWMRRSAMRSTARRFAIRERAPTPVRSLAPVAALVAMNWRYAGWPNAVSAIAVAKEVFEKK
jgi:hypothetical protein